MTLPDLNSASLDSPRLADVDIADVYAIFAEVSRLCSAHFVGAVGGRLSLYALADPAGAATALGASIAGAASLSIDPEPERLKAAVRAGVCDFVVNNLDEAVRILKNEIRKKQPVSVGLVGNVNDQIGAMLERGLQPDLIAPSPAMHKEFLEQFLARGALLLGAPDPPAAQGDPAPEGVWWSVADSPVRWLPKIDALAAETLDLNSQQRLLWLRTAPRYLPRAREHFLPMSAAELGLFIPALDAAGQSGSIGVAVSLRRSQADITDEAGAPFIGSIAMSGTRSVRTELLQIRGGTDGGPERGHAQPGFG